MKHSPSPQESSRRFLLVSSYDPNGVAIILNTLLDLGVRIERNLHKSIWAPQPDGTFILLTDEAELVQWLPSLDPFKNYSFYPDIVCNWTHALPSQISHINLVKVILVRDPRDALFSSSKRYRPDLNFSEYLKTLDPHTLLPRIQAWKYFYLSWMEQNPDLLLTFESIKCQPITELVKMLRLLGIPINVGAIHQAIESSLVSGARLQALGEKSNGSNSIRAIRSGMPNEYLKNVEHSAVYSEIEQKLLPTYQDLVRCWNYRSKATKSPTFDDGHKVLDGSNFESFDTRYFLSLLSYRNLVSNHKNSSRSLVDHHSFVGFLFQLDRKILGSRSNHLTIEIIRLFWGFLVHPVFTIGRSVKRNVFSVTNKTSYLWR